MFRFAKPNGEPFNLDYTGPITAFDSGNDAVAICYGGSTWFEEAIAQGLIEKLGDGGYKINDDCYDELENAVGTIGVPTDPDEWTILIRCDHESLLGRMIATAYFAVTNLEYLIRTGDHDQN